MDGTDWDAYGVGRNPKCANCMVHCGFEPTAVNDALSKPFTALKAALLGPRTEGPLAAGPPTLHEAAATPPGSPEPAGNGRPAA